jgi:sialidase-1
LATQGPICDIFVSGQNGFHTYRIPALLKLKSGVLVAFCEARKFHSDHAENKIVMRLSKDSGQTWGRLQVIADAGADALNNPLAVQCRNTGAIVLMYKRYPATSADEVTDASNWVSHSEQDFPPNFHEGAVGEGFEGKICSTYLQCSVDDGRSWSTPQDITRNVKRPRYVTSYAGGPGSGVQLRGEKWRGRMLMPYSQGPWGDMKVYALLSDDSGKSWRYGSVAPSTDGAQANEVQMAELENGDIYLNARSCDGSHRRLWATSNDGGERWSELQNAPDLLDPQCHASVCTFDAGDERYYLLYCGPLHTSRRKNGCLMRSLDGGKSWQKLLTVYDDFFAYSDLAQIDVQSIGVLFERDHYERVSFRIVHL